MSFSDSRWLILLLLVPALLLVEAWSERRRRKAIAALVGDRAAHPLLEQVSTAAWWPPALVRAGALALLVLGAAGPEWGREVVRRASTGSDVLLVLDVSSSMDARDVPPSRLEEAKREAMAVVDRLDGCRVGIVAFAGEAVRLCPLTLDRSAVRLLLESISTATVSEPGTDIGKALAMVLKGMPGGRRETQAVVMWTDGEDLERGAAAAIDDVARSGIRVFTIGVGTRAGDVVPVLNGDGHMVEVKRDDEGDVVRSRLDEELLRSLARRSSGAYFPSSRPGGDLPRVVSALSGLTRGGRETRLVERPMARFPLCAVLAVACLVFEIVRRRRPRPAAQTLADDGRATAAKVAAATVAFVLCAMLPGIAGAQSEWARGNSAFRAGRYAEAESLYSRRLRGGAQPAVQVNRATARALSGGVEDASRQLGALARAGDAAGRAAGYNLGTILGQRREYEQALQALRQVLIEDPVDEDARWNYEVLLRRRTAEEEEKSPNPEKKPEPKPGDNKGQQDPKPGAAGSPQQDPRPAPSPPQQGTPQPSPSPGGGQGGEMSREQADRLLDALDEMARTSPQRSGRVRTVREKKGRDW